MTDIGNDKQAFLSQVSIFFNTHIPFNRFLGLTLKELTVGHAVLEVPFKPDYVGDFGKQIVHGGVISTLVDVTGGAVAFSVLDFPREMSVNTIDMRVDYIRPGLGRSFISTGHVIRKGNRICVTRIEVANDEGLLIAHGTATYSILAQSVTSDAP